MGRINDGAMRDWNDGDIVTATLYEADHEMLRAAINDNFDRLIKSFTVYDSAGNVLQTKNFDLAFNFIKVKQGTGIQLALDTSTGVLTVTAVPANNSIGTAQIQDGAVTTAKIANLNVTEGKLADSAVTTSKIANTAVTADKIANLTVTTGKLADSAITTAKIADGNVTSSKLQDDAVTAAKLADNAVTTANIVDASVTSAKIGPGAIISPLLGNDAVIEAKIQDGAVTNTKIADGSVSTAKIQDGAVTAQKLDPSLVGQNLELEAHNADVYAHQAILRSEADLGSYDATNKKYTIVNFYLPDDTLYMQSTLSDLTDGLYHVDTWDFYDVDGVTITKTIEWTLVYDANKIIVEKIPQEVL